jgi:hypothetical protein
MGRAGGRRERGKRMMGMMGMVEKPGGGDLAGPFKNPLVV